LHQDTKKEALTKLKPLVETVGYIGRAISAQQSPNWKIGPYIIQSVLTLVAPALFAASIYMELGRIIRLVHGEHLSIVRVSWMTKFFVFGDVFSFLLQSTGMPSPFYHGGKKKKWEKINLLTT
jgi:hypothetical protein